MAKKSDYGNEILVTNSSGVTFDLNKDYSKEMANYKEGSAEWKALNEQREAKRASSAYGGVHKTGSQSSSYGSSYDAGNTATNRTSTTQAMTTSTGQSIDPGTGTYYDPNALMAQNAKAAPIVGKASVYDEKFLPAEVVEEIKMLSQKAQEARAAGYHDPSFHERAELLRETYGQYHGGAMGDEYIPLEKEIPKIPQVQSTFDPNTMRGYLDQWLSAAQQQQTGKIDFATQQAIAELMRTKSDADATFQEQRNQIAVEEAKAKDNQALYAERRGDRGGIGQAQYDIIMATAAQNRLAVNQAQTKLATDTARQISDLRAQGEFEKADALLSLSQQYLSQLISLEQWAAEYNLSVAQFNASLEQWQAEFDMAVADLTGYYNGAPTFKNQQWQTELAMTEKANLAEQGWMFLKAGIQPTASQLAAMGMSAGDAQNYLTEVQITGKAPSVGAGVSGVGTSSDVYRAMYDAGIKTYSDALAYLTQPNGAYYKQDDLAREIADAYVEKYDADEFRSIAEKTAAANGTSMDRLDFEDSMGNKRILNQAADRGGEEKYFVSGIGWLSEQEIVDGLYGNQLDFIFDSKNKNKFTIVGAVTR